MDPIILKKDIDSDQSRSSLIKKAEIILNTRRSVVCNALNRRKIRLSKFLEANKGMRSVKNRYQALSPCIELIENAVECERRGKNMYEFKGTTKSGRSVKAHVREDSIKSGNALFLISCFWK